MALDSKLLEFNDINWTAVVAVAQAEVSLCR